MNKQDQPNRHFLRCFFFVLLMLAASQMFFGCSTIQKYKETPDSEKAQFVRDEAVAWLRDHKEDVKSGLVLIGVQVMQNALTPDEQKEVAAQMHAMAQAFFSLADGKPYTAEEVQAYLLKFQSKPNNNVVKYVVQASSIWSSVRTHLKISGNSQLAIDYFIMFGESAQQVAMAFGGDK